MPMGSPAYMAPEQAAGRIREHGPATDVYALGVILYELLTGRQPHRGETDLETLRLVADVDPPPVRMIRPGLPRDLETIVLKCLEKRPSGRYASALELAADLQRFLDGMPVQARPVSVWGRAGKWIRRRPVHAAVAILIGASLVAVPVGLEWRGRVRTNIKMRCRWPGIGRNAVRPRHAATLARRSRGALARRHLAANQLKLASASAERNRTRFRNGDSRGAPAVRDDARRAGICLVLPRQAVPPPGQDSGNFAGDGQSRRPFGRRSHDRPGG